MSELEIIQYPQVGGISVFLDTVEYRTPHFHPEWELIWILDGKLRVRFRQEQALGTKDSMFIFQPNSVHEFRGEEGAATFLCVQISSQVFETVCPALRSTALQDFRVSELLPERENRTARAVCRRLLREYLVQRQHFELRCAGLCAQLLSLVLARIPSHRMSEEEQGSHDRRSARLTRFLSFVDENYRQKLRLEDFARQEGCSVSYMSRFLKENLNQSFQDYVNTVRFHCACQMIRAGGRRMLDVCVESGFSDYRYFSACFRKHCGMTPEQYARQPRRNPELPARRSVYSLERFYTKEESLKILRSLG